MDKKILFKSLLFSIIISILFFSYSYAQEKNKTGDFDIKKVQEAVKSGLPDTAYSPDYASPEKEKNAVNESYLLITLRIIGWLAIICIIIIGVIWALKRFGLSGSSRIGGGSMDILEVLPINPNRSIVLVRVMDSVLVLAQSPQQITLLEKIEGTKAIELIASTKGGTSIVQFKDVFNNFIGKIKKTK